QLLPDSKSPPVAFLFPGQGTQHVNMGRELYSGERLFRCQLDLCSEVLASHLNVNLAEILYPSPGGRREAERQLSQPMVAQPALFAVEYALATLWMEWGVRPAAMLGHSIGEYVAACLAGVFSLEDALALLAFRGRLTQQLPWGAMLAVRLGEEQVKPLL